MSKAVSPSRERRSQSLKQGTLGISPSSKLSLTPGRPNLGWEVGGSVILPSLILAPGWGQSTTAALPLGAYTASKCLYPLRVPVPPPSACFTSPVSALA